MAPKSRKWERDGRTDENDKTFPRNAPKWVRGTEECYSLIFRTPMNCFRDLTLNPAPHFAPPRPAMFMCLGMPLIAKVHTVSCPDWAVQRRRGGGLGLGWPHNFGQLSEEKCDNGLLSSLSCKTWSWRGSSFYVEFVSREEEKIVFACWTKMIFPDCENFLPCEAWVMLLSDLCTPQVHLSKLSSSQAHCLPFDLPRLPTTTELFIWRPAATIRFPPAHTFQIGLVRQTRIVWIIMQDGIRSS